MSSNILKTLADAIYSEDTYRYMVSEGTHENQEKYVKSVMDSEMGYVAGLNAGGYEYEITIKRKPMSIKSYRDTQKTFEMFNLPVPFKPKKKTKK